MNLIPTALMFALLPVACARVQETRPSLPATTPENTVDALGRPSHIVIRVVDAETGAPIAGATLSAIKEAEHPLPGAWTPVRTATSGAGGHVRMRVDDLRGEGKSRDAFDWLLVDVPGYGPHMEMHLDPVVRLTRGFDVTLDVRDPLGRPAVRAGVGLILGCGHTPDIRFATTDAAGRAVLPCVGPHDPRDLWIVKQGFASDYVDLEEWRAGATPQIVRCPPGPILEGTVLDHDGKPAAGLFVGAPENHRGPWTRTGADGTFALLGATPDCSLTIERADRTHVLSCDAPPSGKRLLLRLPAPGREWEPGPLFSVRVRVQEEQRDDGVPEVKVAATRAADGFTDRRTSDTAGEVVLELPAGEYELVADGALGSFGRKTQALRVADGPSPEVVLRIPRNPTIAVTLDGDPGEGSIVLATLDRQRNVTQEVLAKEPVPVPDSDDAILWLHGKGVASAVAIPKERRGAGAPPLLVRWPRPAQARLELADESGKPVRGWAALLPDPFAQPEVLEALKVKPARSELEVPATWAGTGFLFVLPEDPGLAPLLRAPVTIPARTDVRVDLGRFTLRRRASQALSVLAGSGRPAGSVRVSREGGTLSAEVRADGSVPPLFAEQLRAGDRVEVEPEVPGAVAQLPCFVTLAGPSPWAIRIPEGELAITAKDPRGAGIEDFGVVVDDQLELNADHGEVLVVWVPKGPHRVTIFAAGRIYRTVEVTLGEGERHKLPVTLESRPAK